MICAKIGDDDFNSGVGIKSSGEGFPDIDVRMSLTSSTVTGVMFESVIPMCCGSNIIIIIINKIIDALKIPIH